MEHIAGKGTPRTVQQNADGSWSAAVPLPYFLPFHRFRCGYPIPGYVVCRRVFWKCSTYELHYRLEHL